MHVYNHWMTNMYRVNLSKKEKVQALEEYRKRKSVKVTRSMVKERKEDV